MSRFYNPVAYYHDIANNRYEIVWDFDLEPESVDAETYWRVFRGGNR